MNNAVENITDSKRKISHKTTQNFMKERLYNRGEFDRMYTESTNSLECSPEDFESTGLSRNRNFIERSYIYQLDYYSQQ